MPQALEVVEAEGLVGGAVHLLRAVLVAARLAPPAAEVTMRRVRSRLVPMKYSSEAACEGAAERRAPGHFGSPFTQNWESKWLRVVGFVRRSLSGLPGHSLGTHHATGIDVG